MNDKHYQGIIKHYAEFLPVDSSKQIVSLSEGNTPLIPLPNIAKELGHDLTIFAKFEGLNPTGSFKDRGMTVAMTHALQSGSNAVICASTGNTSASAAAYAASAGMKAFVIIPEGKIARGKLAQAIMHGASVIQISGNFDDGLSIIQKASEALPIAVVNSVNPYRLEGQKTIAFEVCDALEKAPDYHYLPVGNAGNIVAHWMGYNEYHQKGKISTLPVMVGFQAEGAAPIVRNKVVEAPETVATAIRIGNPASWQKAVTARDESNGWIDMLDDEKILNAQKRLAVSEGIFCEPASAISLAGLIHDVSAQKVKQGATIVLTLTGNGLKDSDIVFASAQETTHQVDADMDAVLSLLKDQMV